MKKFEYKCLSIWSGKRGVERILNEYGQEGWELVAVYSIYYYLKREI